MYFPAKPWAVVAHPRPRAANTEGRDGARESSGRAGSEQRALSSATAFPSRGSWRRRDPSSSCFTLLLLPQNRALLSGWNQGRGATRGDNSGTATTAPGAIPVAAGGTAHPHRDIPARGGGDTRGGRCQHKHRATSRAPACSPCAPQPQSTAVTPQSTVSPCQGLLQQCEGRELQKGQRSSPALPLRAPISSLFPADCPGVGLISKKLERGKAIIHV